MRHSDQQNIHAVDLLAGDTNIGNLLTIQLCAIQNALQRCQSCIAAVEHTLLHKVLSQQTGQVVLSHVDRVNSVKIRIGSTAQLAICAVGPDVKVIYTAVTNAYSTFTIGRMCKAVLSHLLHFIRNAFSLSGVSCNCCGRALEFICGPVGRFIHGLGGSNANILQRLLDVCGLRAVTSGAVDLKNENQMDEISKKFDTMTDYSFSSASGASKKYDLYIWTNGADGRPASGGKTERYPYLMKVQAVHVSKDHLPRLLDKEFVQKGEFSGNTEAVDILRSLLKGAGVEKAGISIDKVYGKDVLLVTVPAGTTIPQTAAPKTLTT